MLRRLKAVQFGASFARSFALVAAVVAVGLTLITVLMVGSVQAGPAARECNGSVSIVQELDRTAMVMSAVATPVSTDKLSFSDGYCFKGSTGHHAIGCASGCCATCLNAIDVASPRLLPHNETTRYLLPIQAAANSNEPPPDLRPPRTLS